MAPHENVRLPAVAERDLALLEGASTDQALSEPFEWHGYRDPTVHQRRWEQDHYPGQQDSMLAGALPNDDRAFTGFVVWRAVGLSGPVVCYSIGILLLPEHRGRASVLRRNVCSPITYSPRRLANRVEAGTEAENTAERRALEKAGVQEGGPSPWSRFP
jgi:[ribosomal protein S5]-alanine N-acetyltransferase